MKTQESLNKSLQEALGKTPYSKEHLNEIMSLIREGADVNLNALDGTGSTALIYACWIECEDSIKELLSRHARVDGVNNHRETPLFIACWEGSTAIAQRLIDAGADVDARDQNEFTPLITSATNGKLESIKLLLDNDADTLAQDKPSGYTALLEAYWNSCSKSVELILNAEYERGVSSLELKDDSGESLLDLLEKNNYPSSVQVIKEHIAQCENKCSVEREIETSNIFGLKR